MYDDGRNQRRYSQYEWPVLEGLSNLANVIMVATAAAIYALILL